MLKIRVGLAVGPRLIRAALRTMLEREFELAWDTGSAREAAFGCEVQVLIADLLLPDRAGSDLALELQTRTLLLVTGAEQMRAVRPPLDLPQLGYLPISAHPWELADAVRALARGGGYLHPELTSVVPRVRARQLTPSERRILELLSRGLPPQQMKQTLQVSPNTLKTHLRGIYRKLGVGDRTQAVVEAMRLGLVAGPKIGV